MGKFTGIVVGAAVAIAGVLGILRWWHYFIALVKGSLPAMLIFAGVIALIAGISELKDEMAAKKEENKEEKKQ